MLETNPHLWLNTVDVNVLNLLVKRWRQSNQILKTENLFSLVEQESIKGLYKSIRKILTKTKTKNKQKPCAGICKTDKINFSWKILETM